MKDDPEIAISRKNAGEVRMPDEQMSKILEIVRQENARRKSVGESPMTVSAPPPPELVLQATFVNDMDQGSDPNSNDGIADGAIVTACLIPWLSILMEIENDPDFLFYFAKHPRKFEEFLAATYDRAGYDEVILTPRSNDGGRDVIAIKRGFGSVRILEQAKAYSPGHLVKHDDVRAMLGVLAIDANASKGIITTTSDFAPGIYTSEEFGRFMPHRLETRNGHQLAQWVRQVHNKMLDRSGGPTDS